MSSSIKKSYPGTKLLVSINFTDQAAQGSYQEIDKSIPPIFTCQMYESQQTMTSQATETFQQLH
jgi:hypothetical protein